MDDERQILLLSKCPATVDRQGGRQRGSRSGSSSSGGGGASMAPTRKSLARWDREDLWGPDVVDVKTGTLGVLSQHGI